MLAPIRTLISLAFIAVVLWFSFAVPLGGRTLAQHMDRIGQTPEARELMDGTRSTVNPVLEEAADRVLGERVEAPTHLAPADIDADAPATEAPVRTAERAPAESPGGDPGRADPDDVTPARALGPGSTSTPDRAKLPGR